MAGDDDVDGDALGARGEPDGGDGRLAAAVADRQAVDGPVTEYGRRDSRFNIDKIPRGVTGSGIHVFIPVFWYVNHLSLTTS